MAASPLSRLRVFVNDRVQRWARRRQGPDHAPFPLERRRIYILPTKFGVAYAITVFAMLLGSMNYNNSLGFALTFLLAALGLVVMHHCHRNLAGLVIANVQAGEAFAGGWLKLAVGCENPSGVARFGLRFECLETVADLPHLPAASPALATLELPAETRGVLRIDRISVSTGFPLGLFRAWSWIYLPVEAVVYPRPAGEQAPPPSAESDRGALGLTRRGDEDFRGFRSYHPGDSPRRIAWKALARGAPLLVKDHAGATRAPLIFELGQVQSRDLERGLSQLCRWIVTAEAQLNPFGLRLPGVLIAPESGAAHRRRCLTALALVGAEQPRAAA
ncbi:MAG TPA: DUF58 domain-containing protein [Steroidobacteraceae bacterium]|jgi:uncharacterized protein (DUF58 family)|nr:DUF58 domain-containing protein [Steroidobacteraceae bacterium]